MERTNDTTLVFQYGSNCLDSEINGKNRLKGDAKFIGIAQTVEDYELAFDVFSRGRHCAASDIVCKAGGKVWGALYEIPKALISRDSAKTLGRKSLDAIEGEGKNYERKEISVRTGNGEVVSVLTYTVINPQTGLTTDLDYVHLIIAGLRQRAVPSEYVDRVKAVAAANNPGIATAISRL
jgi:gamma-glutamylcyclotransferase (GGCT)/AIG2-like uncharacterized protein YtfP